MTTEPLNPEAIRARVDAATPGPWHWAGNTDNREIYLATWISGYGRCTVMDFSRWGMQGARPRFAEDLMMVDADKRVVFEVAKTAKTRIDPRVYRADIVDIRHPDADLIAHAPADLAALLAENATLRAQLADAEAVIDGITQVLNEPVYPYGDKTLPMISERASIRELYGERPIDAIESLIEPYFATRTQEPPTGATT